MDLAVVSMIKNEESVIGRMIESAAPITDIFIFTDTGSIDNTKQVIKETCDRLGVPFEIHDTKFIDFGTTRTETVKNAEGKADYFLLLDADMVVHSSGFDKEKLDKDVYHIYYTGANRYAQMLLVKDIGWYYIGKTHEYIFSDKMRNLGDIFTIQITHHHDGANRKDKFERDRRLLEESIKENPEDSRAYFYLAQTYKDLGDTDKAIENYRKRIARDGWAEEIFYSIYQLGRMYERKGEKDQARITLLDAWEYRPRRVESLYVLSLICRQQKKYHQALLFLEKAINTPLPKDDKLFIEQPVYDYLLRFEYALNLFFTGKKKEAKKQNDLLLRQELPTHIKQQIQKNNDNIKKDLEYEKAINKSNPKYNKKVVYISGYTKDTEYEQEIKKLKSSLDKFGLEYCIYPMANQGNWIRNTQEKIKYMYKALTHYKCPIVWVDADAEIKRKTDYWNKVTDDIQYYHIKEWDDYLTGTLFLNYNQRVLDFINTWVFNNEINNVSSQKTFINLLKKGANVKTNTYPKEYCKIFDNKLMQCDNPVIEHYQASRRFKNSIPRLKLIKKINNKEDEVCSVIGNGPFKSDLSEQIDDSFVIRCNNFKTGKDYKEIGTKVDLCASSMYHEILPKEKVNYTIVGIHPINSVIGRYSEAKDMFIYWNHNKHKMIASGNKAICYNEGDEFYDMWIRLADSIGKFPTTGMAAIALARYRGFKKIILSGFNFFKSDKTHYFTDEITRPSPHHEPDKEAQLLKYWIENDDIEYVLDEYTKESLKDIEPLRYKHIVATRFNLGLYQNKRIKHDPDTWMDNRLKRFEKYTLRSISKQKQDFDWVVFFDPDTPDKYKERIESLRELYPFIPVYKGLDDYSDSSIQVYKLLQEYIHNNYSKDVYDTIITTRIDNDDNYIGNVFKELTDTIPVSYDRTKPLGYNLSRGIISDGKDDYDMIYKDSNFVTVYEKFNNNLKTVYYTQHGTAHIHKEFDIRYLNGEHRFRINTDGSNLSNDIKEAKKYGQIVKKI